MVLASKLASAARLAGTGAYVYLGSTACTFVATCIFAARATCSMAAISTVSSIGGEFSVIFASSGTRSTTDANLMDAISISDIEVATIGC